MRSLIQSFSLSQVIIASRKTTVDLGQVASAVVSSRSNLGSGFS